MTKPAIDLSASPVFEITAEDQTPRTFEQTIRGAIYAAHAYHFYPIVRCGHRESILLPIWEYERLVNLAAQAQETSKGEGHGTEHG